MVVRVKMMVDGVDDVGIGVDWGMMKKIHCLLRLLLFYHASVEGGR